MLGLEDEVDYTDQHQASGRDNQVSAGRDRPDSSQGSGPQHSAVTPIGSGGQRASMDDSTGIGAVRPIRPSGRSEPNPEGTGQRAVVRPVPIAANAKPHVVRPTSFNEAQMVADTYKVNQPVVMDLQEADRDLARRLIDFASGLCYGLGGQMERLDTQVYLLTPSNVAVSDEERRRLRDRGYDT